MAVTTRTGDAGTPTSAPPHGGAASERGASGIRNVPRSARL